MESPRKNDRVIRPQADARTNGKETASKPPLNQTSSVDPPVHSRSLLIREAEPGTERKSQRKKQRAETAVNFSQPHAKKKKKVE